MSKGCPQCGYVKPKKNAVYKVRVIDINYLVAWAEGYRECEDDGYDFAIEVFRERVFAAIAIGQLLTIAAYFIGRW